MSLVWTAVVVSTISFLTSPSTFPTLTSASFAVVVLISHYNKILSFFLTSVSKYYFIFPFIYKTKRIIIILLKLRFIIFLTRQIPH